MSTDEKPLVLVLDDDHDVLLSLERLLRANGFDVRTYRNPQDFYDGGLLQEASCVLLDQHLEVVKGTDVHREMIRRGWSIPTVYLTADWDTHTVVEAIQGGAVNYLTKPYDPQEMIGVVREACERCKAQRIVLGDVDGLRQRAQRLTSRELLIVSMVVKGMLNKEIADQLNLAVVTVKLHRGRAMKKLGAQNAADLARMALLIGL